MSIPAATAPARRPVDWLSILQLTISVLAALFFFGRALVVGMMGLLTLIGSDSSAALSQFLAAANDILIGILVLPSAGLALLTLRNRPEPGWAARFAILVRRLAPGLVLAWPVLVLLGYWISEVEAANLIFLPWLSVLATGIPILALTLVSTRGLRNGSAQRGWGILTSGITVGPTLIVGLELIIILVAAGIGVAWLLSQPDGLEEMNRLAQRLANSQFDSEVMERILGNYLARPGVLFALLAVVAGFAPLIEELLKPLAVWLVALRHPLTPGEGFTAGVISGAGFTLLESLGAPTLSTGQAWTSIILARVGTDLLHIFTTGLVGWALAYTWQNGRFVRLAGAYLLAVLVHGAWNTASIWIGITPLLNLSIPGLPAASKAATTGAIAALVVLAVGMFVALLRINKMLRKAQGAAAPASELERSIQAEPEPDLPLPS
jgi:hypothetical protein